MTRKPGERPKWLNGDNSYTLLTPVEYLIGDDADRVHRLQLRRLTAVELLILDEPLKHTEKVLRIIEGMTGLLRVVTLKLDAVDIDRIDSILGYFMEPGSVTGATS